MSEVGWLSGEGDGVGERDGGAEWVWGGGVGWWGRREVDCLLRSGLKSGAAVGFNLVVFCGNSF